MPDIKNELRKFHEQKQKLPNIYSGSLGILINGEKVVEVPNRPGFVFVRLQNMQSEFVQALNGVVSPVYDLPVLVTHNNSYYAIYGRDVNRYSNWMTQSSYVPSHHAQHEFDPSNNGGGDVVWVRSEQFYPLLGFPSGSTGADGICIAPYRYFLNGTWMDAGNTGTISLLSYKPTGTNNARFVLVGIDTSTTIPTYHAGSEFSASLTGTYATIANLPTTFNAFTELPVAAVRLTSGTSKITWGEIYDVRQFYGVLQQQSGSAGVSAFTELSDVPNSYVGSALKAVRVNASATGLEFTDFPISSGSSGTGSSGISDLSQIILIMGDGSGTQVFAATDAGFDSAVSAAVDYSRIIIPPIALSSYHVIPRKYLVIIGTNVDNGSKGTTFTKMLTFNNEDDYNIVWMENIYISTFSSTATIRGIYFTGSAGSGQTDLFLQHFNMNVLGNGRDAYAFSAATANDYSYITAMESILAASSTSGDSHEYLVYSSDGNITGELNFCQLNGIIPEGTMSLRGSFFNEYAITGAYSGNYLEYSDRSFFFVDGTTNDKMHSYDIYNNVPVRHMPVPTVTGSFAYVSDLAQGWKEKSFDDAVVDVLKKHGLL